jgi:hypothetical protein
MMTTGDPLPFKVHSHYLRRRCTRLSAFHVATRCSPAQCTKEIATRSAPRLILHDGRAELQPLPVDFSLPLPNPHSRPLVTRQPYHASPAALGERHSSASPVILDHMSTHRKVPLFQTAQTEFTRSSHRPPSEPNHFADQAAHFLSSRSRLSARRLAVILAAESSRHRSKANAVRSLRGIVDQPKGGHCSRSSASATSARLVMRSVV